MAKISVRFYGDHEVRALWDEENSKWWFSVVDVVGALNGEENHLKNRNYWKYLKGKLRKEGHELVSVTNQFKLAAADGKRRLTDMLDDKGVLTLAACFPSSKAMHTSVADPTHIKHLLFPALTDKTEDRETFMKGIDYSYYYEEED